MIFFLLGLLLFFPAATQAQTLTGGEFEMRRHGMGPVSQGEFSIGGGTFSFSAGARALISTQYPLYETGGKTLGPTPGGPLQYMQTMNNQITKDAVTVSLRQGSVPENFDFFINADPQTAPLRASPSAIASANLKLSQTIGPQAAVIPQGIIEINLLQDSGAFWDGPLAHAATVSIGYQDNDSDGIVDGSNPPIRAKSLGIYLLDADHGLWVRLPGSSVDAASRRVTASVPHFSVYALISAADQVVDNVYAFPVPWAPNSGNPLDGTLSGGITFTNLPSEGTITIYTLSGQLVQTLPISPSNPQLRWDGRTSGGRDVVSGVYLWRVQSGNNKKLGKLVVIR